MTAGMESGLRHRLRRALRHMEAQHRHLGPIQRELHQAVADGTKDEVIDWLLRYTEALSAHFELEDGTVFPAIRGLVARAEGEILALVREHQDFLEWLDALRDRLATQAAGSQALEEFTRALRDHEAREEALLATVMSEAS